MPLKVLLNKHLSIQLSNYMHLNGLVIDNKTIIILKLVVRKTPNYAQ